MDRRRAAIPPFITRSSCESAVRCFASAFCFSISPNAASSRRAFATAISSELSFTTIAVADGGGARGAGQRRRIRTACARRLHVVGEAHRLLHDAVLAAAAAAGAARRGVPTLGAASLGGAAAGGVGLPAEEGVEHFLRPPSHRHRRGARRRRLGERGGRCEERVGRSAERGAVRGGRGGEGGRGGAERRGVVGQPLGHRRPRRRVVGVRAQELPLEQLDARRLVGGRLRQRRDLALRLEHRTLEAVILLLEDRDLRLERLLRRLRHLDRLELLAEPFGLVVAAARL